MIDPPARFFPTAPLAPAARKKVQCAVCKELHLLAEGETFAQRCAPAQLGDRRVCGCKRLQITGAPGWEQRETDRRRLGI